MVGGNGIPSPIVVCKESSGAWCPVPGGGGGGGGGGVHHNP